MPPRMAACGARPGHGQTFGVAGRGRAGCQTRRTQRFVVTRGGDCMKTVFQGRSLAATCPLFSLKSM